MTTYRRLQDVPSFAPCPQCGGDKGFESEPWGVNYEDGSPLTSWIPCEFCYGLGEVPTEPAGEEWLDENNG